MTKKQRQVLDHAVSLFAKYGYNQIGIDRICEASNVSKMTVYKYFPTKEVLFEAALNQRHNDFITALEHRMAQHDAPVDQLKAIFRYHHCWFKQDDFNGCLFINSISLFNEGSPAIGKIAQQHKAVVAQIISRCLNHLLPLEEAESLTLTCGKLLDGAIISAQLGVEQDPAYQAWLAVADCLAAKHIIVDTRPF